MTQQATETKVTSDGATSANTKENSSLETTIKSLQEGNQSLQKTVEELQAKLLDDDYIEYLNTRKGGNEVKEAVKDAQKGGVLPAEINQVLSQYENRLKSTEETVRTLSAILELEYVRKQNPDFPEYEKDVQKILETATTDLTFEQALDMARGRRKASESTKEKTETKKESPKPPVGEKPSSKLPNSEETRREYKSRQEADQATVQAIKERYGIMGDKI